MNTINAPIPTEYDEVLFRSKSEAILARALHIEYFMWEYEPAKFCVSHNGKDWTPDFFAVSRSMIGRGTEGENNWIFCSLIEYKPSEPTDTYKRLLADRFDEIGLWWIKKLLITGGIYDKPLRIQHWTGARQWADVSSAPIFLTFPASLYEAQQFRFDLK